METKTPILMSQTNPNGWKLEELLKQIQVELNEKSKAMLASNSEISQLIVDCNVNIIERLSQAIGFQELILKSLSDKYGNDKGPLSPRIEPLKSLPKDKLDELFEMQEKLNDLFWSKTGVKPLGKDGPMKMAHIFKECQNNFNDGESLGPNGEVNRWLNKFAHAMRDEMREFEAETLWKWWSKDKIDIQNLRVEVVDQLHFWLSIAMTAGLTSDSVFDIYLQKNSINYERAIGGYNQANKNEDDNKKIKPNS